MISETRQNAARGIVTDVLLLGGVLAFGWRVEQVLLTYWFEVAAALVAAPALLAARGGVRGLAAGLVGMVPWSIFSAFHAFFLVALLYGVDWSRVQGTWSHWSAPGKGEPWEWFVAALADAPWWVWGWVVASQVGAVVGELWASRRKAARGEGVGEGEADEADVAAAAGAVGMADAADAADAVGMDRGDDRAEPDQRGAEPPGEPVAAHAVLPGAEVVIMHVTIIVGASAMMAMDDPLGLLLTLIALRSAYQLMRLIAG